MQFTRHENLALDHAKFSQAQNTHMKGKFNIIAVLEMIGSKVLLDGESNPQPCAPYIDLAVSGSSGLVSPAFLAPWYSS